jgi:hypothetical protein
LWLLLSSCEDPQSFSFVMGVIYWPITKKKINQALDNPKIDRYIIVSSFWGCLYLYKSRLYDKGMWQSDSSMGTQWRSMFGTWGGFWGPNENLMGTCWELHENTLGITKIQQPHTHPKTNHRGMKYGCIFVVAAQCIV